MEDWEREHVDHNLPKLLEVTNISPGLLAELMSFSPYELKAVECEKNDLDKASKLYTIAKMKPGGYDELTLAFNKHKVLGALKIFLEGYKKFGKPSPLDEVTPSGGNAGTTGNNPTPNSSGKRVNTNCAEMVVGSADCSKADVATAIKTSNSFAGFDTHWKSVAGDLEIPEQRIKALAKKWFLQMGVESLEELVDEFLSLWMKEKGDQAKLGKLCTSLRRNGLTDIAQCLEKAFGGSSK